ncbi:MAG TPA: glycogen debranching N-terminal domain-containing protein [Gemmatimonadaceae bacterium]|nr:glycogen debranching N-terminal domain-containing protein [Gemmatimonadaceae bacterium]
MREHERKQRILTHGTPSITSSIADAVVIKQENIFFLTAPDGNVPVTDGHGFGLYYHDCRYLRGYELRLAGGTATVLASTAHHGSQARFQLANPDLRMSDGRLIAKETIGIRWTRTLDGAVPALADVIELENFGLEEVEFPVTLHFVAKFEDIFAVRGLFSEPLGTLRPPRWEDGALVLAYDGKDGRARRLVISFDPSPTSHDGSAVTHRVRVASRGSATLKMQLRVDEEPEPSGTTYAAPRALHDTEGRLAHMPVPHATLKSDSLLLNQVVERSLADLRMLRSSIDGQEFFAAGVPWFATLFGRDSLITALQTLAWESGVAEQTARLLARYQGHRTDNWRDEQPGKILHSLRVGEMARLGEIPHTPYYGSVDATPLFLILIGRQARWSGRLDLFHDLRDHIELALQWMRGDADADGDGFIEYASTSERGLINQGWKDSGDAIVDADGHLASPPVALVEVQGYAYQARQLIADLYERDGDHEAAARLRAAAQRLRERFNRDFWIDSLDCYALALEKGNVPLRVVSSNPGHALWTGIADEEKARRTAHRLMQDDMFSGWGIRTLSAQERRYNPVGYHLGTVWPHDNSLIVAGLRRYGFDDLALRVVHGITEAAMNFTGYRLPELFAGFSRADYATPVHYPVACHPQAWAAGSIPYMLETLLGLVPDAFEKRLRIVRPMLPDFVDRLDLRDVTVGDARVSLRFQRGARGATEVSVLGVNGTLEVAVDQVGS